MREPLTCVSARALRHPLSLGGWQGAGQRKRNRWHLVVL